MCFNLSVLTIQGVRSFGMGSPLLRLFIFRGTYLGLVGVLSFVAWGCQNQPTGAPQPIPETSRVESRTSQLIGHIVPVAGAPPAIMMLRPHVALEISLPSELAEMDQYGRAFFPQLLVVKEDQVVRFKNSENELHNVNVTDESGATVFNIGMPILGGMYDHVFEQSGRYAVRCNVHQEMAATIFVTANPFAGIADREGRFSFSGVPYGSYDLIARRGVDQIEQVVTLDAAYVEIQVGIE